MILISKNNNFLDTLIFPSNLSSVVRHALIYPDYKVIR